jgi:galactokinase
MPSHAAAFAPGRVNLIGEHTDYNEGLALPFAIAQGVTVRAREIGGRHVEALARDLGARDRFELERPLPAAGWRGYVRGAVVELRRAGVPLPGARIEIAGDVPRGAGMSSSAALQVALCLALIAMAGAEAPDDLAVVKLCSRIEHEWVGAQTGLLDQLASLCCESERALRIDFRSLALRSVPLALAGFRLVMLDSGQRHTNARSGYNRRRAECAQACGRLGVASLREADLAATARLPRPLSHRARHVLSENERVHGAVAALERGDLVALGALLDASHASLRDCYEVSTPAVEAAVDRLKCAGAIGARIVGGGFGGSVLGLLPADASAPEGAIEVRPGAGARLLA